MVAVAVIGWALKKYLGIEMDKNQRAQAEGVVQGVEDKVRSIFKKTGRKVPSEVVHQMAVNDMKALSPGISDAKAVAQIDSAVGVVKTVGATAEVKTSWQPDIRPLNIP